MKVTYIIDPQDLAMSWLKFFVSKANKKSMDIVQASDFKLGTKVELSVKSGRSLIIKDLYKFEPFLLPLLKKEIINEEMRCFIQLGTKRISYHNNFELFLISKTRCNEVPSGTVRIVNFTITTGGLQKRLLSNILECVRPTLGDELRELSEAEEKCSSELIQMEAKLLEILCTDGDLLQNSALIEMLVGTKQNSMELSDTLAATNEAKRKLDLYYEQWIMIADAGSHLYFAILQLHMVRF